MGINPELVFTAFAFLAVHTGALLWWGATLTAAVKQHDQTLLDHEQRLREAKL